MQKRLTRKLDLELVLSKVKPHPSPSPSLEQYVTPVDVAANMLYLAAYCNNDILGKTVLDLGCGTGRLALGAAFLGSEEVVGVDIDRASIKIASENSANVGLEQRVEWIVADVESICGSFDTVLQNPPFGVQKRHADRGFLRKALEVGKVVYSLHKSKAEKTRSRSMIDRTDVVRIQGSPFLRAFIEKSGGCIRAVYPMKMVIPHMFDFHSERKHEFWADLYVIDRR